MTVRKQGKSKMHLKTYDKEFHRKKDKVCEGSLYVLLSQLKLRTEFAFCLHTISVQIYTCIERKFRACLLEVGDPGLVGLVSFVFTLWGT